MSLKFAIFFVESVFNAGPSSNWYDVQTWKELTEDWRISVGIFILYIAAAEFSRAACCAHDDDDVRSATMKIENELKRCARVAFRSSPRVHFDFFFIYKYILKMLNVRATVQYHFRRLNWKIMFIVFFLLLHLLYFDWHHSQIFFFANLILDFFMYVHFIYMKIFFEHVIFWRSIALLARTLWI